MSSLMDLHPWEQREVFALAYRAEETPTLVTTCDAIVVVASRMSSIEGQWPSDASDGWQLRRYLAELPDEPIADLPTQVSGAFIRTSTSLHRTVGERQAAMERVLADAVLWEVTNCLSGFRFDGGQPGPIILLGGPLTAGLRGRLLYRMISDDLPIVAVSYEPSDVERLAANVPLPDPQMRASAGLEWHGPFPPLAIDDGSRFFVATRSGKPAFVVEMPCSTAPANRARSHWEERKKLCGWLFRDDHIATLLSAGQKPLVGLPKPLSAALNVARQVCVEVRDDQLGLTALVNSYSSKNYARHGTKLARARALLVEAGGNDANEVLVRAKEGRFVPTIDNQRSFFDAVSSRYYEGRETEPELTKLVRAIAKQSEVERKKGSLS